MDMNQRLEQAILSRFRKLPMSTLDDVIEVVSPGYIKDYIDIDYNFHAFKNRFNHFESDRAETILAYNTVTKELHICNIYTHNEYKGKGYSRLLVQAIEDVAIRLAAKKVVAINSTNDSFWEHMGYSKVCEEDCPRYEREIFF